MSNLNKISDTPPVFPCWLYNERSECWSHWKHAAGMSWASWKTTTHTHWHPDQPTAPDSTPSPTPQDGAAGTPISDGAKFSMADMPPAFNMNQEVVRVEVARTLERALAASEQKIKEVEADRDANARHLD